MRLLSQIENDIQEQTRLLSKATKIGDLVRANIHMSNLRKLNVEKENLSTKTEFMEKQNRLPQSQINWAGKTLSLVLNLLDASAYYMDMYANHIKDTGGFETVPEWREKINKVKYASRELAQYNRDFFLGSVRQNNYNNLDELLELLKREFFADDELPFYDKYENM